MKNDDSLVFLPLNRVSAFIKKFYVVYNLFFTIID